MLPANVLLKHRDPRGFFIVDYLTTCEGWDVEVFSPGDFKPEETEQFVKMLTTGDSDIVRLQAAFNKDDVYIGDVELAIYLTEQLGIAPEPREGSDVCSIGFSEKNNMWYGWSHRAIAGFSIGDSVKKGDCAFVPSSIEDAIEKATSFWQDEYKADVKSEVVVRDGEQMIHTTWKYTDQVPNEKLRSMINGTLTPIPEKFGRGEWTAQTIEDAKQMAIDYAEGVG